MKAYALLVLMLASFGANADQPQRPPPERPDYCETYEDDCERDNDEDGRPDNEEEEGRP